MIALAGLHARSVLRGRGFTLALAAFALGVGLVTVLGLSSFRQLGLHALGPSSAALLSLSLLLPTALCIVMAAGTVAAGHEGLFAMVRARGVRPAGVVVGVWLAITLAGALMLLAGFGAAALVFAGNVPLDDLPAFGALGVACLLAVAASSALGVLLGVVVQTRLHAILVALGCWFLLAVGLDLLVIGLGVFLAAGEPALLAAALANPIGAARLLGLLAMDAGTAALGSLGTYLEGRLGMGSAAALLALALAAWTALPLAVAGWALGRRDA